MTFLELCQALMRECGITGTLTDVEPTSDELQRVVAWINAAWLELQRRRSDWAWMRSSQIIGGGAGMSFATVAGQAVYPLGSGAGTCEVTSAVFSKWVRDEFRCYTTAAGTNDEQPLGWVDYDEWRNVYMFSANRQVQTRPVAIAFGPLNQICLGLPPNGLYTITGDYFLKATEMADEGDTPTGLATDYHMMIVYAAMMKYAGFESAPEVYQRGRDEYRPMLKQLESNWLPEIRWG